VCALYIFLGCVHHYQVIQAIETQKEKLIDQVDEVASAKEELLVNTIVELEEMDADASNGVQLVRQSLGMASSLQAEQMEKVFVTGLLSKTAKAAGAGAGAGAGGGGGGASAGEGTGVWRRRTGASAFANEPYGSSFAGGNLELEGSMIKPISLHDLCGGVDINVAEVSAHILPLCTSIITHVCMFV